MFVSEDGTVTGSINVARLDEVEAKTPEAQAQLDQLKADRDAGQQQLARDEERLAELSRRQNPQLRTDDERSQAEDAGRESSQRQQREADRLAAEQQQQSGNAPNDEENLDALRTEAEQVGVTVDKRWGADRLRQEIDKSQQKRG